ncbi:hypothetical protein N9J19_00135, partial [bacterium]|nr:hypothetical protein [bacterium]
MKLNITGDIENSSPVKNEVDKEAMGGTELMKYALYDKIDSKLMSKFNIIPSRVRELSDTKKNILWLHDLP